MEQPAQIEQLNPAQLLSRIPRKILEISRAIEEVGGECYLVGGWVRDTLLGFPSKDYDIEVHRIAPEQLEQLLSRFGKVSAVGKSFGILLMKIAGEQVDFALPRRERKVGVGHRDFSVDTDPMMGFEAASARRDFTINAMGIRLPVMELCDLHGGLRDLQEGLLRHVGPAFSEDPLRALRGAQFAARFELKVAPDTLELCAEQDLSVLSPERIDEEFRKLLLKTKRPSIGLQAIRDMRLLRFFPELDLVAPVWDLLLRRTDAAAAERLFLSSEKEQLQLMFSTLCSALSAEQTAGLLNRITRDKKVLDFASSLLSWVPALLALEPRAGSLQTLPENRRPWVRRLSMAMSIPLATALLRSHLVALTLPPEAAAQQLFALATEAGVVEAPPTPWVQGRDLIELGMVPGPQMGELVRALFERQLDEQFLGPEQALEWARSQIV